MKVLTVVYDNSMKVFLSTDDEIIDFIERRPVLMPFADAVSYLNESGLGSSPSQVFSCIKDNGLWKAYKGKKIFMVLRDWKTLVAHLHQLRMSLSRNYIMPNEELLNYY